MSLEAFTKAYYKDVCPVAGRKLRKSYGQTFNANPSMSNPRSGAYKTQSAFDRATSNFGMGDHQDFEDHHRYMAGNLRNDERVPEWPNNKLADLHERAANMHADAIGTYGRPV